MSSKKRTFTEVSQTSATPRQHESLHAHVTPWRTNTRLRSARSVRHVDARIYQPQSARGILRRFAKITAPVTKRRISTPTNVAIEKENRRPRDEDVEDDNELKWPTLNFQIEESIDEDDSELPVAPTPSALLDQTSSDNDDGQPTETFHKIRSDYAEGGLRKSMDLLLTHSEPDMSAMDEDVGADYETTFLTERGRRAISEEATKMSRYSFGSIHMSGFGSELEIRRESGRSRKSLAFGEADVEIVDRQNDLNIGGETENLKNLIASPSSDDDDASQLFIDAREDNDTFQLDIPDAFEEHVTSHQQIERDKSTGQAPPLADDEDTAPDEEQAETLSVNEIEGEHTEKPATDTAVKSKPRNKLKLNKRGNLVPSIPSSLIRHIVHESCRISKKRKISLGKEHMKALEQATEWYFEQVSEDLEAYASHGKRKKRIDESDVLLLMRRQRLLQDDGELRRMAKQWLPSKNFEELDPPERL